MKFRYVPRSGSRAIAIVGVPFFYSQCFFHAKREREARLRIEQVSAATEERKEGRLQTECTEADGQTDGPCSMSKTQ